MHKETKTELENLRFRLIEIKYLMISSDVIDQKEGWFAFGSLLANLQHLLYDRNDHDNTSDDTTRREQGISKSEPDLANEKD